MLHFLSCFYMVNLFCAILICIHHGCGTFTGIRLCPALPDDFAGVVFPVLSAFVLYSPELLTDCRPTGLWIDAK